VEGDVGHRGEVEFFDRLGRASGQGEFGGGFVLFERVVARLAETGRGVLLIEQRVSLALQVASWGYLLADGRVRLEASAEELRSKDDLGSLFLGRAGAEIAHGEASGQHAAGRSA